MPELKVFEMPEDTIEQIITKITAYAWDIRGDWSDPRGQCSNIVRLCDLLKEKFFDSHKDR